MTQDVGAAMEEGNGNGPQTEEGNGDDVLGMLTNAARRSENM